MAIRGHLFAAEEVPSAELPKLLQTKLATAMDYWADAGNLIPDLAQVQLLHGEMFEGCYKDSIAGELKTGRNFVDPAVEFTHPEYVKADYKQLVIDSNTLLPGLGRRPAENKDLDPDNPEHWPDPGDHQAWINRAVFVSHFHARFIFIHPFEDGNGRTSRVIAWEQLRRLFPEVYRLPPSHRLLAVDDKDHPFFIPMNYPDAKTAYLAAMESLKVGRPNLFHLATYFLPRKDVSLPYPLMSPFSFFPTAPGASR